MGFDKDGVRVHVGQASWGAPCALQQPQASTSQQPLGCSWAPPSSFLTRGIPQLPPTTPKSPFLGALRPGKAPRVQLVPTPGNPPVGHCGTVQRRPQSPAHPARLLFFFPPIFPPKKTTSDAPAAGCEHPQNSAPAPPAGSVPVSPPSSLTAAFSFCSCSPLAPSTLPQRHT